MSCLKHLYDADESLGLSCSVLLGHDDPDVSPALLVAFLSSLVFCPLSLWPQAVLASSAATSSKTQALFLCPDGKARC